MKSYDFKSKSDILPISLGSKYLQFGNKVNIKLIEESITFGISIKTLIVFFFSWINAANKPPPDPTSQTTSPFFRYFEKAFRDCNSWFNVEWLCRRN